MTRKDIEDNCPDGYSVCDTNVVDMLDKTELWRIYENHSEPHLARIPQDLVDYLGSPAAGRAPKEWGRCLYYKVVRSVE